MKVLAVGTCCADVYPAKGVVRPGGEALNIAVQLSQRADTEVSLMGLIGKDDYAAVILDSIQGYDIDTGNLKQVDGETANHVIQIDTDGDRYFEAGAWHGGVSGDLRLDREQEQQLADMDAVMMTLWEPNLRKLLELKQRYGYLAAVDFNDQRDLGQWDDIIDDMDIFFLSASEVMKPAFYERSKRSDTIFVLTFGENGSVAYHRGESYECDAEKVDPVVDTTGCGDCYQGHFVCEYIKTGDIFSAMKKATAEAAKVTAHVGGFHCKL